MLFGFFLDFLYFYNWWPLKERNLAVDSDESSGAFIDQAEVGVPFDLRERHFCSETVSEQSSSERLSSSPVMISPPGTGTPVYINSQPESIDLDSNSSSLGDLSIINYDSWYLKFLKCSNLIIRRNIIFHHENPIQGLKIRNPTRGRQFLPPNSCL